MKSTRLTLITFIFSILSINGWAQNGGLNFMFYNVENLFDTIDNPLTQDEDFTPSGKHKHGTAHYHQKLDHLSKVVNAAFDKEMPDLLGLCEVENQMVVEDLKARFRNSSNYEVVWHESNDVRGIDNAVIYNGEALGLIKHGVEEINLGKDERPTRPMLWALFEEKHSGQQVLVFVNHWPSRSGGEEKSNWKRLKASETLQRLIIRSRKEYPEASMIAMGDFNDYPTNQSLVELERCKQANDPCLTNMHKHIQGTDRGSYAYKGEWGMLDQMLVSKDIIDQSGKLWVKPQSGEIISYDWMLYESSYDQKHYPSRTYSGDKYFGGYSDHLPVKLTVFYSE